MVKFTARLLALLLLSTAIVLLCAPLNISSRVPLTDSLRRHPETATADTAAARVGAREPAVYEEGFVNEPVPGLASGRKIAGAVFLVAGLLLMTGLYMKKPGIMIAKIWTILLWDIIVVIFSLYFVYGALDLLFMKIFGTGMATEEFIQFMGLFWVVVAIPGLVLFISVSAAQAVIVNEKGISLDGLFSKKTVSWDELKRIEVSELYGVKDAAETVAPASLLKILFIEGETLSITLMEPPLKSTKKRILEALLSYAPAQWEEVIKEQGKVWKAFL